MKSPTLYLLALFAAAAGQAQTLELTPNKPDGIYAPGEPIVWNVAIDGDATALKEATYRLKLDGGEIVAEGPLDLTTPNVRVEAAPLSEPGTLLAEVTTTSPSGKSFTARGGAVVDPYKIKPAVTRPADFDEFWKKQIATAQALPLNVHLEPGDSGRPDVEYFKVTLDNVDGTKVHAQLARPKDGKKFPGLVVTQWAGVYGLNKGWVVGHAAQGWLVINVMAHDLPIDETPEFYKKQSAGPLKNYAAIGNGSRETSYFRRMILGDLRAVNYLTSRPDWDGETLVAHGGSKGGYQSIVIAALDPRFTAVVCEIPAGCEITGSANGRGSGWPAWSLKSPDASREAIIETSRYYDTVNFAPHVKVPTLVGLGLIDITCPPSGILSMFNQLAGPKETVIYPLMGHKGPHPTYDTRASEWLQILVKGKPAPVAK